MRKTAPKIVHYKARPPHTAILDSLGPPARPHNPCNPWICSWRRGRRRGWLRGCRFWKSKYIGTSRAIRNYPDLVLGTSERFRTVQRHLRTVPNGSEAPPNGSERFRGPLCRFTSGLRVVCVPVPVCSVPWEFSVEGRGFAVQSSDGESRIDATRSQLPTFWLTHLTKNLSEFAKSDVTVRKLCVTHLLFSWTFDVWPSVCCISCFPLQRLTFIT